MKKRIFTLLFGSIALSLGIFVLHATPNRSPDITFATYTNGDAATYYDSIDTNQSGNALLTSLRTLNLSKRQSTVGYSSMGTSPSGQFKYTDYDPAYVQYDSNGQPYGTRISSFYTYTSATSFNREHVWPNSHGGGSGGDAGSPYPDADIHMPRPTISSENSSRGNSFFVEGMNNSSSGWDPYTAGYNANSRGEAARITFYCTLVNSKLILAPNNTTPSGTDSVTGQSFGSGHTMGNLETLIKWNINYPVTQREKNRNEGAEYLQGNRNPFVDHPEYACKIWGNVNNNIKSMCASASWDSGPSVIISMSSADIAVDDTALISATSSDGSNITWSSSDTTVVNVSTDYSSSETYITLTGVGPGTATITAKATINNTVYTDFCIVTVSSSGSGGGGGGTPLGDNYTIVNSDVPSSYPTSATEYTANSGIKFYGYNVMNQSNKVQFKKSGGYLYNSNSLNLGALTISGLSGNLTVYAGTTRNPSSTTINGSSGVYDLSGYNYFKIINNTSSVASCSSITVSLAKEQEKTLSSISVNTAPNKLIYTSGEYFDPSGLIITRTYSNSSSDTYTYNGHENEFSFSPSTSTLLNTNNSSVTITHNGKSCSQEITVNAPVVLTSISVDTSPNNITYIEGEYFDPTGLVIRRNYSNSTYDTYSYAGHEDDFSFSPSLSTALTLSNSNIVITYSDKVVNLPISVNSPAKTLLNISISGQTTSFSVDETFTFGGIVTAHYSDLSSEDVTLSALFSGYDMSSVGDQTVTVSYTYEGVTKIATYDINVAAVIEVGESGSQRIVSKSNSSYFEQGSIYLSGNNASGSATCDAFTATQTKVSGNNNVPYTYNEIRVYANHSFTITPNENYSISSVVITANSNSYANAIGGAELNNCSKGVNGSIVTLTPIDNNSVVGFVNTAQSRINYIVVNYEYLSSGSNIKTLSHIGISNEKTVYTVGDTFVKPTVTAYYSNSTSEDVTDLATCSGYDMSTNNIYEVTVSYTYEDVTISTSYEITVVPSGSSSISIVASVNKTYYVGDSIVYSDITVKNASTNETISSFLFNGSDTYTYQFKYEDADSGGALTNKTFENAIFYGGSFCDLTVQVQRKAYGEGSGTENCSISYTDLPTTYQTSDNEITSQSGIKFIAYNLANYSSKMQFKASGGYFQTTQAMKLKSLTINNPTGNALTVYGSNNANSFTTSISGTNNVYDLSDYTYFRIIRNGSGAAYCSSITIEITGLESANNVSNFIMFEDTNNQCLNKLNTAINYLNNLSESELQTFKTSENYVIATARGRLEAWARSQGNTIDYTFGSIQLMNIKLNNFDNFNDGTSTEFIIIISSISSAVALTLLLVIKKKRRSY